MNRALFIFIFLVLGFLSYSQDILYLSNGDKLSAKITEINPTDVKYKDFTNLGGPTYVISNSELVLIQYSNGTTQVINSNPRPIEPKKESPVTTNANLLETKKTKLPNLYYMNSNLLSINALALTNGDVTLIYDRELFNCKMSVSFLGGYNFNSRMGVLNSFISDTKDNAKKKLRCWLRHQLYAKKHKKSSIFYWCFR